MRDPRADAVRRLRKAKTVFLSGHVRPDGDCLGSALALQIALRRVGKKAVVYSRDPVPQSLLLMRGAKQVRVGVKQQLAERFDRPPGRRPRTTYLLARAHSPLLGPCTKPKPVALGKR